MEEERNEEVETEMPEMATEEGETAGAAPMAPEGDGRRVVGIDLGTSKCVVSILSPGASFPTIVINEVSNRQTASAVFYHEGARLAGDQASYGMVRRPTNAPHALKPLLGGLDEAQAQSFSQQHGFQVRGGSPAEIHLRHDVFGDLENPDESEDTEELALPVPFVVAQLVRKLAQDVQRTLTPEQSWTGLAFAMDPASPSYSTELVQAFSMAGLSTEVAFSGLSEGASAALCYAFRHKLVALEGSDEGVEETVLFLDMGEAFTRATVARLTSGGLTVLSEQSTTKVSGQAFTEVLASMAADKIREKFRFDVRSNARWLAKLRHGVERSKVVMSTVEDASLDLENVHDQDLHLLLHRAEFEALPATLELLAELTEFVRAALGAADVTLAQLTAVEVLGGGFRMPCVQTTLESALAPLPLRRTMDGTSSVAHGLALYAGLQAEFSRYTVEGVAGAGRIERAPVPEELETLERRLSAQDAMLLEVSDLRNGLEKYVQEVGEKMAQSAYAAVFADSSVQAAVRAVLSAARGWIDEHDGQRRRALWQQKWTEVRQAVAAAAPLLETTEEALATERRAQLELAEQEQKTRVAKPRTARTKAERLHLANSAKTKGNAIFKELDYSAAAAQYISGLSQLKELFDLSPEEQAEVDALKVQLNVNTAACCFKLGRIAQAVENCNDALAVEPANVKALYRRSQCHVKLKDFAAAVADLKAAAAADPSSKELRDQLTVAQRLLKSQQDQQKKMYARMFG